MPKPCKHCGHQIKFEPYEWDHAIRWRVQDLDGKPHDCAKHWLASNDRPAKKKKGKRRKNRATAAPASVPVATPLTDDRLPARSCGCAPWDECDCPRAPKDQVSRIP